MRGIVAGIALCLGIAFLIPVWSQPPNGRPTKKLPITSVTLFNVGIGYFYRSGAADNGTQIELNVDRDDVNDLLKSLLVSDSAGTLPTVTFDSHIPAETVLRSFALDLGVNPSMANLLHQARGEQIVLTNKDGTTVTGHIVSVEKPVPDVVTGTPPGTEGPVTIKPVVVPVAADAIEQVNVLTDDGIQSVPLRGIRKLRFTKPELEAEVRAALKALATVRSEGKKQVTVQFPNAGNRQVGLGYIAEAPLWKPTYRLVSGPGGSQLQAWAIVENTTEDDWNNVEVSLVSGHPTTFQMNLYEPLFVPRSHVEVEAFAALRPPLNQATGIAGFSGQPGGLGGLAGGGAFGQPGMQNLGFGGAIGLQGQSGNQFGIQGGPFAIRPSLRTLAGNRLGFDEYTQRLMQRGQEKNQTVAAAGGTLVTDALAITHSEPFRYRIATPVTLPRLKTAMLLVHRGDVTIERLSLYNPTRFSRPLLSVKVTNKLNLFLPAGPVAIFEEGSFAGEARLPDCRANSSALLSHAIDLHVHVTTEPTVEVTTKRDVVIRQGVLVTINDQSLTTKHTATNRSPAARQLLIEHPNTTGRTWSPESKPVESTPLWHRFALSLNAGETKSLSLVELAKAQRESALLTISVDDLQAARRIATRANVIAAIDQILLQKRNLETLKAEIATETTKLQQTVQEQSRIRTTLEGVASNAEVAKRFTQKINDLETQIETIQGKIMDRTASQKQREMEFGEFVAKLTRE